MINFIKARWICIIISLVIILTGVWFYSAPTNLKLGPLTPRGFNLGNDFKGGIVHQVTIYSGMPQEEIRQDLIDLGLGNDVQRVLIPENKLIGKETSYLIKIPLNISGTSTKEIRDKIDELYERIKAKYGATYILTGEELKKTNEINSEMLTGEDLEQKTATQRVLQNVAKESENIISPSFSLALRWQAVALVIFTISIMFAYITFRFKFIKYAVGGILALVHDLFVMLCVISILQLEFDYAILASILFILGYSINDTIVVYDRIRENFNIMRNSGSKEIINFSINQTLSRTIITSLTTLLADMALLIWGGPKVEGFSISVAVGILSGTYSSIFIAAPIVDSWEDFFALFSKKRRKKEKGAEKVLKTSNSVNNLENSATSENIAPVKQEESIIKKDKLSLSKKQMKKLQDLMKKKI